MTIPVDANTFRIRVEAKVNIIAKSVNWILSVAFAGAAYLFLRAQPSIDPSIAPLIALAVGGAASWLIVDRPMKRIETQFPLFDDDD